MRRCLFLALSWMLLASASLAQDGVKAAMAQAEKSLREGRYATALECLRQAEASGGGSAAAIAELRRTVKQEAQKKLRDLLEEGERLEVRGKISQAIALLEKSALDFPAGRDFQGLLDRLDSLRGKLAKRSSSLAAVPEPPAFPEDASREVLDLYRKALDLESSWKLEDALAVCRAALAKASSMEIARPFASLAEDAQRQIWCLAALRDSLGEDPSRFRGLDLPGVGKGDLLAVSAEGVRIRPASGEETVLWEKFSPEAWARILGRANFDPYDRCQAAVLLARRGLASEADRWLATAAEKDPEQKPMVDSFLARRRGIEVPERGFVWFRDSWMSFREKEEFRYAAEIEKELAALDREGEEQERALDRLANLGRQAATPLRLELSKRVDAAWSRLKDSGFLKIVEKLQEQREELERRRKFALELIFDEEKYFYPYNPPECPPEKAKLYPAVQKEVDKRVAALREIWDRAESVSLSRSVRETLSTMRRIREFAERIGARVGVEDDLYPAILAIDPEDESLSLRSFCRDPRERSQWLEWNRRAIAFNALAETSCTDEEKRQIAVTNQYRILFGRKAVAVNEKLQQAARRHSQEMSEKGYFSHFSPTPDLRTPMDRVKKQGYAGGASENIASGASDAESAHEGWIHSSGHHRNILDPSHRELGSGQDGSMWTQNFGSGKEYEEDPAWAKN